MATGGPEAYAFVYLPQSVTQDFALRSPGNQDSDPQGLSHFDFCLSQDEPIVDRAAAGNHQDGGRELGQVQRLDAGEGCRARSNRDVRWRQPRRRLHRDRNQDAWGTFTVSGVITISDPLNQGFVVDSVADSIIFGADGTNFPHHPTLDCANVDDAAAQPLVLEDQQDAGEQRRRRARFVQRGRDRSGALLRSAGAAVDTGPVIDAVMLTNPRAPAGGFLPSAAAQRVHDLDLVAGLQHMAGMRAARHDRPVDLDRDAAVAKAFGLQQFHHAACIRHGSGFAIEEDVHGVIVARRHAVR